jgi:hypothetical protein
VSAAERVAGPAAAQAQLLVQRERAGGGADDGERALARLEVEHLEGGHAPAVVLRVPAEVVDRGVVREGRGPVRWQLELARRKRAWPASTSRPSTPTMRGGRAAVAAEDEVAGRAI